MKALKLEGRKHEVIDIGNTLEALQNAVAGYIETVRLMVNDAVMIVNEEGRLLGLPYNTAASNLARQPIFGTALVVGVDGEEFTDIPDVIA